MISKWYLTGDTHGNFARFGNYDECVKTNPEAAVIVLGDVGLNWTLDENDSHMKNALAKRFKFRIYCLRGNHEARPDKVPGMELVFDDDIQGSVWMQKKWQNIRYLKDYGIYTFDGHRTAVIGGAYSVDKWYRLERGLRWYDDEQLTEDEMNACSKVLRGENVELVFSHTCPLRWEPADLFLNGIDQSKVDKTMERFLDRLCDTFHWDIWCFGHYHADRIERPCVEQYFHDTDEIRDIIDRWTRFKETGELDWWLNKSPNFYFDVPKVMEKMME